MLSFNNPSRPSRSKQTPDASPAIAIGLAGLRIAAKGINRPAFVSPLQTAIAPADRGPIANLMRALRGRDGRPLVGAFAHARRSAGRIAIVQVQRVTSVVAEFQRTIFVHQADFCRYRGVADALRQPGAGAGRERPCHGRNAQPLIHLNHMDASRWEVAAAAVAVSHLTPPGAAVPRRSARSLGLRSSSLQPVFVVIMIIQGRVLATDGYCHV